jgi:hypothetical protein
LLQHTWAGARAFAVDQDLGAGNEGARDTLERPTLRSSRPTDYVEIRFAKAANGVKPPIGQRIAEIDDGNLCGFDGSEVRFADLFGIKLDRRIACQRRKQWEIGLIPRRTQNDEGSGASLGRPRCLPRHVALTCFEDRTGLALVTSMIGFP